MLCNRAPGGRRLQPIGSANAQRAKTNHAKGRASPPAPPSSATVPKPTHSNPAAVRRSHAKTDSRRAGAQSSKSGNPCVQLSCHLSHSPDGGLSVYARNGTGVSHKVLDTTATVTTSAEAARY